MSVRWISSWPLMLKVALLSAVALTGLWLLAPSRTARTAEAGVVEITMMHFKGPLVEALDDAVRVFEEESRRAHERDPSRPVYRVVSGQTAMRSMTEDPTRFLLSVVGDMPPDVIYFDRFAVAEWAARDAFADLTPFVERDRAANREDAVRAEDYFPATWEEVVFTHPVTGRRGLYGIPDTLDSRALFYNKDLLKRAGYVDERGEARPPRTWEELGEMAAKLTEFDKNGRLTRLGFNPSSGLTPHFLYMYGWANGAEALSADGRKVTLNEPRFVGALDWLTGIYDRQGGLKEVMAFQSAFQGEDLDLFLTGKTAMKMDGFWVLSTTLAQYGRNMNYGVAPPPLPAGELAKGRAPVSWIGGWCFSVPANAKHPDAAWELIRFLSSRRARLIRAESQRLEFVSRGRVFVPDQSAYRAVNDEVFERYIHRDPGVEQNLKDAVRVFNEVLPSARYRPATPVGGLMFNLQITANEEASYHLKSSQAALDGATATAQRELDRTLHPPTGKKVDWRWFGWAYGALLLAAAVSLYYWDTSPRVRAAVGAALGKVGLGGVFGSGGVIEGAGGSFFRRQWRSGFLCALPWIAGFVVFTGGPLLFSIIISFCDYDILHPARFTGLQNYARMFTDDPLFGTAVRNTVFMLIGVPLGMAISLGIALLLNRQRRGVAWWRTFFYLPSIVPAVAASILWFWVLNPQHGLLNHALGSLGIRGPTWLQDAATSKPSLILMSLWGAGGGMIVWLAGLKGISESYYEAARIDGATAWQQFRHITLPLLSPYIFFNLVMGLIGTLQVFASAFIMTQGGPINSTLFYVYHLFNQAFRYLNMGYASALAWVLVAVVFALTVLQMRLSKRWVHYEGD